MIAPQSIQLELWLGGLVPAPAPDAVMRQLKSAEITCSACAPGRFRLTFRIDRSLGVLADFQLLDSGLVDAWNRVIIMVRLGARRTILIDGFITTQDLAFDKAAGAAQLVIAGEDISIAMDRVQISLEYPQLADSLIAELVLVKYAALGVIPEVIPTPLDITPIELQRTPQQNATDRAFLQQLADRNGCWFAVRPGPEPLMNVARWGPPLNADRVQPPLSIDLGAATNVEKVSFALDAAAPVQMLGIVQDTLSELDLPLATVLSSRLPPLATSPALDAIGLMQRRELYTDPRYGYLQALNEAQVRTDTSSQDVLKVSGEVDTARYGAVIETQGLIDLRGAGTRYDGRYRIEQVTHSLVLGEYRQSFALAREGTGSTIAQVAA